MNSFTQFIFKRKQIQFLELLFAIVNIVLILFVIIIGTVFAYSEMKEIGNWIKHVLIFGSEGYIGLDLQKRFDLEKYSLICIDQKPQDQVQKESTRYTYN